MRRADLNHVDYVALSADAKAQYDTAKRFIVLADQAIKDRNFVFARTLADKAAVIAGVLSTDSADGPASSLRDALACTHVAPAPPVV